MTERQGNLQRGFVQVYTGNGKGKTTAALGLAVRAAGAGLKVFIGQFTKGRVSSEHLALERFSDQVTVERFGEIGFIRGRPSLEDLRAARAGLERARAVVGSGDYDLVILDEANIATKYGLITVDELLELIEGKPGHVELVLTGRNADPRVIARADLVTEMVAVKHYLKEKNVAARKGIER